jgi:hypothetical protein
MEIIEPNPKLMEYIADASSLFTDFDGARNEFLENEEWHYIQSELEQNIHLLNRLDEKLLLSENVDIFDCGIGLGTAMFDLYLQSKDMKSRNFTFSGVEKHNRYLEFLEEKLIHYWEGVLKLHKGEIMNFDYSPYNMIYTYSPFKTVEKLESFYKKLVNEISPGSLIIESRNFGKGFAETLANIPGLEEIKVDFIFVYRKI